MFSKLFISLYHRQSSDIESDEDWEPVCKKPHTEGHDDSTLSGEEPHPTPSQRGSASRRPRGRGLGRGRGRGRGRTGSSSSQAEMSTSTSEERWNGVDVPDVTPPQPTFRSTNSPGPKLIRTATYSFTALPTFFYKLLATDNNSKHQ